MKAWRLGTSARLWRTRATFECVCQKSLPRMEGRVEAMRACTAPEAASEKRRLSTMASFMRMLMRQRQFTPLMSMVSEQPSQRVARAAGSACSRIRCG
jgi:hypothetical protein